MFQVLPSKINLSLDFLKVIVDKHFYILFQLFNLSMFSLAFSNSFLQSSKTGQSNFNYFNSNFSSFFNRLLTTKTFFGIRCWHISQIKVFFKEYSFEFFDSSIEKIFCTFDWFWSNFKLFIKVPNYYEFQKNFPKTHNMCFGVFSTRFFVLLGRTNWYDE